METPFVINPKASQDDLEYELHGYLDELHGMLDAMGVAVHAEGIMESSVLAASRHVRQIQKLVEEVTTDKAATEKREAVEAERKRRETYVRPYFDQETDEAKRAQLEEFITDDDIAAELSQIRHAKEMWVHMVKQDEERLKLVDALKAKRADTIPEYTS